MQESKKEEVLIQHENDNDGEYVSEYEDRAKVLNKKNVQGFTAFNDDWDNWFPWEG